MALGRTVVGEDVPLDEWQREVLEPIGLPEHVQQHIATMARLHREDRYNRATDDVERITGQPAQTVEQYVAVESRSVLLTAWIAHHLTGCST